MIVSLACFTEDRVRNTLAQLNQLINLKDIQVYENWSVVRDKPVYCNSTLIQSDNRLLDFSSWHDSCQTIIREHGETTDTILFLNDTVFERKYSSIEPDFIQDFFQGIPSLHSSKNYIYGYIDDFPKAVQLNTVAYSSWIRSNLFAVTMNALKLMNGLIPDLGNEAFIDHKSRNIWSGGSRIMSENLKAYLGSWLFGLQNPNFPEYSLKWHSARIPTQDNCELFEKKIRTILCEHSLGLTAKRLGIQILDSKKHTRSNNRWTTDYYG